MKSKKFQTEKEIVENRITKVIEEIELLEFTSTLNTKQNILTRNNNSENQN